MVIFHRNFSLIEVSDVKETVKESVTYGAFDLANALAEKNFDRVLEIARDYLDKGTSVQELLGSVHWQVRRLYLAKQLLEDKVDRKTFASTIRIGNYFVDGFIKKLGEFEKTQLELALSRLTDLDAHIKTGKVDPIIGLEKYFAEVSRV